MDTQRFIDTLTGRMHPVDRLPQLVDYPLPDGGYDTGAWQADLVTWNRGRR